MEILIMAALGLVFSIAGAVAIPLSSFIKKIEDGLACEQCEKRNDCFAKKRLRNGKSDWLNEFMLFSYCKVKKKCPYGIHDKGKEYIFYIFFSIILMSILFWSKGMTVVGITFGISSAILLSLSVVDWNTQYIPFELNGIIFICGLIRLFADLSNWVEYVIGLIAVSGFLLLTNWIATPILRKKYESDAEIEAVIGDGDIKLMAATGLLLGWKLNFLALGIGCIAGSVIHVILMKIKGSDRQFALGPYLSLGVYITMICGEQLVGWYLNIMGVMPL